MLIGWPGRQPLEDWQILVLLLALGTVAGVARRAHAEGRPLFLLWLDAHSDFHTPMTTIINGSATQANSKRKIDVLTR